QSGKIDRIPSHENGFLYYRERFGLGGFLKRSLLLFIFFFNSAYALTIEPILEARTLNLTQSTSNPDGDYKYESDGFATGFGLKVEGNPGTGIIGLDYRYGSSDYKLSTPDGSSLTSKLQYQRMMLYFKY